MKECRHCGAQHITESKYCPITGLPVETNWLSMENRIWGNFKLKKFLGEGPIGVVYLAEHMVQKNNLIVKIVDSSYLTENTQLVELTQNETAKIIGKDIKGIPKIFTLNQTQDGVIFVSRQFVEGITLREFMGKKRDFTPEEVKKIGIKILSVINNLHNENLVHLSIKPENILISSDNIDTSELWILDSGISIFSSYAPKGNWYRSPEQIQGITPYTPASDIFSIAVIMYELIAKNPPFHSNNFDVISTQIVTKNPPLLKDIIPDTPEDICMFINKCLEKNPKNRFKSASEMLNALNELKLVDIPYEEKHPTPIDDLLIENILKDEIDISHLHKSKLPPKPKSLSDLPPLKNKDVQTAQNLNMMDYSETEVYQKKESLSDQRKKSIIALIIIVFLIILGISLIIYMHLKKVSIEQRRAELDKITNPDQFNVVKSSPRKLKMVNVHLKGLPPGCQWKFDDQFVNANPFKAPYSIQPRKITVWASGFSPFEVLMPLTEDVEIDVKLVPLDNTVDNANYSLPAPPKGPRYSKEQLYPTKGN